MSTLEKIVLTKPTDRDLRIFYVRARATQIWKLVDPDVFPNPPSLNKPPLPQFTIPENDADFDLRSFNAFKKRLEMYKMDFLEFEQQNKALGDITAYIPQTYTTMASNDQIQISLDSGTANFRAQHSTLALTQSSRPKNTTRASTRNVKDWRGAGRRPTGRNTYKGAVCFVGSGSD
ncbi:hypothetical protein MMC07_000619 [Pseudocyphellaria aurata]|nr:hypothetical protein [Pseudocyphellaria aurata]